MFGIPKTYVAIGAAVALAILLMIAYNKGYKTASLQCDVKVADIKQKITDEYIKQIQDMIDAAIESDKYQKGLAEQIESLEEQQSIILQSIEEAANADPNAENCGIGAESAKRLNEIQ